MNTAAVVGGGISGILCSILLKKKFDQVYLIEKENKLGGLFSSYKSKEGFEFDYGSHFLRDTGVSELDEILYGHMTSDKWLVLENLRGGNYFCSHLNEKSPFPDTRLLPEETYQKGMMQMLCLGENLKTHTNLEEYLEDTFGEIFTKKIYRTLANKFLGHDLCELVPGSIGLIALLSKIIGFTPEMTRELKKSPLLDKKFAFHSCEEGQSSQKNYYPVRGGVGLWIDEIEEKLSHLGVNILRNSMVEKINHTNGIIDSVILQNGESLGCDQLIWTAPVYQIAKCGGLSPPFEQKSPARLITSLYHFIFDQQFLTDLQYFICNDPDMPSFRVTLYPNIQGISEGEPGYRITVEVLTAEVPDLEKTGNQVHKDLLKMGVVSNEAKIIFQESETICETFPVPTPQFVHDSKMQLNYAKENLKNVLFLGKNTGNTWFMQDILVETYNSVNSLLKQNSSTEDTPSISFQDFEDSAPGPLDGIHEYFSTPMPSPPQKVLDSFHGLEYDPHIKSDWNFRKRGFSHGVVTHEGVEWKSGSDFFQSKAVNGYMGGVIRHFPPAGDVIMEYFEKLLTSKFYKTLLNHQTYNFGLHQIRILTDESHEGIPVPEGIHQDGFDFVAIHCFQRCNIEGGVSTILQKKEGPIMLETILPPNNIMICNDRNLWHNASPIHVKDKGTGYRDVCVVTFDKVEQQDVLVETYNSVNSLLKQNSSAKDTPLQR